MSGKRRKKKQNSDNPDTWDIVPDSQEFEEFHLTDFDIVPDSQDLDAVSSSSPSQEPAPASTYRLKETTKDTHSSVICKLTRVLRLPELHEEIKRICVVMKQVQLEGWHLANLHVLRCLQESEEVIELEQVFFYRCCVATLGNIEARDRGSSWPKYPSFHRSCSRYRASRERVPTFAVEDVVYGNSMINEMARMMNVNALNMIALHFRRRLHQYICFRYAPEGKIELKYRDTKRLVDSCYRVKSVPEVDENDNPTGKIIKVWTEWDETTDPVELELRKWLGMVPWQWVIRKNSAHFIRKLYDMLVWMEDFVEDHPNTKGARLYSLLPVSTSFQVMYVKINASTLHGLFARLIHLPKINEFLMNKLNIDPSKKKEEEEKEEV